MSGRARTALLISLILVVGSSLIVGKVRGALYTRHGSISITGDTGFTLANGVIGGSGTASNPYIIQGWEINTTQTVDNTAVGLAISNTRAYFQIRNVYVHNGNGLGIMLEWVTNGVIDTSLLSNSAGGMLLFSSSNITVSNNTVSYNKEGLVLANDTNITVRGNAFNSDGIYVSPSQTNYKEWNSYSISSDNLVNGKPLLFYNRCSGLSVQGSILGQLMVSNCANITISNLSISNTDSGIQFANVTNVLLANTTLSNNLHDGLTSLGITDFRMADVNASANYWGLQMWSTKNATVSNSIFSTNRGDGVDLAESENVTFATSIFSHNSEWALAISGALNLKAFHNDFIENNGPSCPPMGGVCSKIGLQVQYSTVPSGTDSWDDGYPSGGNFWSDYNSLDVCGGPLQSECVCPPSGNPCPDGIGDTPRPVQLYDTNNPTDRYPLMKPYHPDTTPPTWTTSVLGRPFVNYEYLTSGSVWLYWSQAIDDVKLSSYRVYANNTLLATIPCCQFGYNATGLSPDTTYVFKVVAVDVDGNTSLPISTTITTPGIPASPPTLGAWYLIPIGIAAALAVLTTHLLTKRHYRQKPVTEKPEQASRGTVKPS